ncbi:MAG: aminoglycoside phosphotransferase family protein [Candidatus Binataceae bacterium]
MRSPDEPTAALEAARRMIAAPIGKLESVGGGRNSRVYRVRAASGDFALKEYPSRRGDPRDRLGTEVRALELMGEHRFDAVPQVIAVDRKRGFVLFSWVEGASVDTVGESDIDRAAAFLAAVHRLRHTTSATTLGLASEACLSGSEVERQIKARTDRLLQTSQDKELRCLLGGPFAESFARLDARAKERMAACKLDFSTELSPHRRTLVPSDFGFHNSLRRKDGSLVFLDFEYFGWDDPVKLTADVMLHPGTRVAPLLVRRFRRAVERFYGNDPGFADRLDALYPLFALRWVLILLNEFLPDRWQRRVEARIGESWETVKTRQLARARALLAQTEEADGGSEGSH